MNRITMINELFPNGIPKLWCPILTHYTEECKIDFNRIMMHIKYILPYCSSYLIPGSTGDAWELSEAEINSLLEYILRHANVVGYNILIGALETDADKTLATINKRIQMIKNISGCSDEFEAMQKTGVKGFVVCPPANVLNQNEVYGELEKILKCDLPVCLYQLPQVTNSEMTPETVSNLVKKYPNFFMVKDSSGEDKIANADSDYGDVYLVRGAEGKYAENMKEFDGNYDGFLLSSVNSFPQLLGNFTDMVKKNHLDEAKKISDKVAKTIASGFDLVSDIKQGNAFANVNKCFDYWNAYGLNGNTSNLPMLHAGVRLDNQKIAIAREILNKSNMLQKEGYID